MTLSEKIARLAASAGSDDWQMEILEHPKGQLLISCGIGRMGMIPPGGMWEEGMLYAEFAILLSHGDPIGENHPARAALRSIAERISGGEWLGYGHLLPVENWEPFVAMTLYPLPNAEGSDLVVPCPDGRIVTVYQVVPLTKSELDFRLSADGAALLRRMPSLIADPNRPPLIISR
ncbi:MAG: suppressor of fused domain protein [Eubacteriales bacterium]